MKAQSGTEKSTIIYTRPVQTAVCKYLQKHNPKHPIVHQFEADLQVYQSHIKQYKDSKPIKETEKYTPLAPLNLISFKGLVVNTYLKINGVQFNRNANNAEADFYLQTLLYYFARDAKFLQSPLLAHFGGVENSLGKGLLILGGYGCGKTSLFTALYTLFTHALHHKVECTDANGVRTDFARYRLFFQYFTANEVVEEYESCQTPADKEHFWNRHKRGLNYYDDILTERTASHYGKFELFKDLLEKRYACHSTTLMTCNYYGGNTENTLQYFKERYGARVCDRLYAMFNIIELKGGTLRK